MLNSDIRHSALLAAIPHLVWTASPEGKVTCLSPQWETYTGVPEEEHLGDGWLQALHPEDRAETLKLWAHCLETGEEGEARYRLRACDGSYRWFKVTASPVLSDSGDVSVWVGSNIDIQDLMEAEERLMALNAELERKVRERADELAFLNERWNLAAESANVGVWDWDIVRNTLQWDDHMFKLFPLTKEEFSGDYEAWRSMVHPEDLPGAEATLTRAMETGEHFEIIFRLRPELTESTRYISGVSKTIRNSQGDPIRMVGLNRDVTKREVAERGLAGSRRLLQEFVKYVPAAIAMLDRELRFVQVSERWLEDYGLPGADLTGRAFREVLPEVAGMWESVHQRVLDGEVVRETKEPVTRRGKKIWLHWECRPWSRVDGSVGGILMFTQPITERVEMEEELLRQREQLKRSNRNLEQYAHAASHDLQAPLRAVVGCAQILEEHLGESTDSLVKETLFHIVGGARRMKSLIQALLGFSRLDEVGELQRVEMSQVVEEAASLLSPELAQEDVQLNILELPAVQGNETLLMQLVQNLLTNAIKYRGEEPLQVEIGSELFEEGVRFWVRDNGIGIEPAFLTRIFEVFQRLHTYEEYPGTGIGLALCQRIVEGHGGNIWAESEPGSGSTFFFTLPAA